MIKYGKGYPTKVPNKYSWYIDLETNITYQRKDGTWFVFNNPNED